jgi:putative PIN family toxin of toxin-antitoxin system
MRLVVDANLWISALLKPKFQLRTEVFFEPEYHLLVSEELFRDLDKAFRKPYLSEQIVREKYDKLVFRLQSVAELVDVHSVVNLCRDPKDNFLLALAKDGNADYLISGDRDLLVLREFENTTIVTISEFENISSTKQEQ